MTTQELEELREMPTARIRKNYRLCQDQLRMCASEAGSRLDKSVAILNEWADDYLDELVRRGVRA